MMRGYLGCWIRAPAVLLLSVISLGRRRSAVLLLLVIAVALRRGSAVVLLVLVMRRVGSTVVIVAGHDDL